MRLRTCALALGIPAVLTGCGASSSGGTVASGGGDTSAGPGAYEVKTTNYAFSPSTLQGTPGKQATVHLTNDSGTQHNFSLAAQQVDTDIPSGKDVTVTITFPASGQLTFVCKYHQSKGMAGALVVGGAVASLPPPTPKTGGGYHY